MFNTGGQEGSQRTVKDLFELLEKQSEQTENVLQNQAQMKVL